MESVLSVPFFCWSGSPTAVSLSSYTLLQGKWIHMPKSYCSKPVSSQIWHCVAYGWGSRGSLVPMVTLQNPTWATSLGEIRKYKIPENFWTLSFGSWAPFLVLGPGAHYPLCPLSPLFFEGWWWIGLGHKFNWVNSSLIQSELAWLRQPHFKSNWGMLIYNCVWLIYTTHLHSFSTLLWKSLLVVVPYLENVATELVFSKAINSVIKDFILHTQNLVKKTTPTFLLTSV